MQTSQQPIFQNTETGLQFLPEDSLANLSRWPESERERHDRYLWPAMLGIIQTVRPTWVIGENVIGIASMVLPGEITAVEEQATLQNEDHQIIETEEQRFVIDRICEDLEQARYSVQPIVIPACSIGAPHKRDRVWFVARLNENEPAPDTTRIGLDNGRGDWQRGFLSDNFHGDASQGEPQWQGRQRGVGSTGEDVGSATDTDSYGCDPWWRDRNGKSENTTERNGVQPDAERSCQERPIADTCSERPERRLDPDRSESPVDLRSSSFAPRQFEQARLLSAWRRFPTQHPIYPGDDGIPRGLAGRTFSHKKWRTEAVKACGNAIVPQVAYEILKCIREIEINR